MTRPSVAPAAVTLLAMVHAQPGVSRAEAARALAMPSGFAAETTARLVASRLLAEHPLPTGRPGRPTTALHPHPAGPLVAVAAIAHETWQVAAVQLGGTVVASAQQPHGPQLASVLDGVGAQFGALHRQYGERIAAWAVSVPGIVAGDRLLHAPNLGWHDVDLAALRPAPSPAPFLAGNDATFAGLAEHRRGAAAGAGTVVHLFLDAGVGGALMDGRGMMAGATGTAGEYGHLPLGEPNRPCQCGARGCWNTSLDGQAIARFLHQPAPADQVAYTRDVIAAARAGGPDETRAISRVARSLGRGAAALVNALDPAMVTIGGLGPDLLAIAGGAATTAYHDGLMAFRRAEPPPLVPARFGAEGPLTGAAEEGFSRILASDAAGQWAARQR
jgi:predicted NBD/HSP70 family sugar kinase